MARIVSPQFLKTHGPRLPPPSLPPLLLRLLSPPPFPSTPPLLAPPPGIATQVLTGSERRVGEGVCATRGCIPTEAGLAPPGEGTTLTHQFNSGCHGKPSEPDVSGEPDWVTGGQVHGCPKRLAVASPELNLSQNGYGASFRVDVLNQAVAGLSVSGLRSVWKRLHAARWQKG